MPAQIPMPLARSESRSVAFSSARLFGTTSAAPAPWAMRGCDQRAHRGGDGTEQPGVKYRPSSGDPGATKQRGARGRCLNCPTRRSAAGRPPAQVTQTGLPRPDEGAASKTPRSGARPWSRPQTWHKATLKPSGAAQQFHPSWVTGTGIWTVAKCRVDPGSGWREGRSWPWRTGRPPFQGKSHAPWPLSGLKGSFQVNALALVRGSENSFAV